MRNRRNRLVAPLLAAMLLGPFALVEATATRPSSLAGFATSLVIDGVDDTSFEVDMGAVPVSSGVLVVGTGPLLLDELAVHDRALSTAELAARPAPRGPPPEVSEVSFAYDGNNLRRARVADGVTTRYSWDVVAGLPQVAVERTDGAPARRYVHDGWGPVQVGEAGQEWFTHRDTSGSVVAVTDEAGATAAQFRYDAYGNVIGRGRRRFYDPHVAHKHPKRGTTFSA